MSGSSLAERKCKACEGGVAPLGRGEAEKLLKELSSEWVLNMEAGAIRSLAQTCPSS